jgi:hypothetical protein
MSLLCSIIQKTIDNKFFINMQEHNCFEFWTQIGKNIKTFNVWEPNYFLYMYCSNLYYSNNNINSSRANDIFIKKKFFLLNQILDNIFFNENLKNTFLLEFSKAQRTYFAFAKFANIYRYKKASIKMNVDLYMNELNPNKKNVITILQGDSKYLFLGSDLVKVINSSLLNSSHFFAEPLEPKNPFNNLPFNNATLYNIYFHIKHNCENNPILFHLFFKANFDLDKFLYDNESIIRETAIKNYAENSPASVLRHDLEPMLATNRRFTKKIFIHDDIPVDKLVDIFRPYFHLFYLHRYGVYGTDKRSKSFIELKTKLRAFVEYNPMFGRKIYKKEKKFVQIKCAETNSIKTVIKTIRTCSFNLNHMNFYKNNINNVINHLINTQYNISFMRFNSPVQVDDYYDDDYEYDYNNDDNDDNDSEDDDSENDDADDDDNDNETPLNEEIVAVENIPEEGEIEQVEHVSDSAPDTDSIS